MGSGCMDRKLYQNIVFLASLIYKNMAYPDNFRLKAKMVKLSGFRAEIFEFDEYNIIIFCGTNSIRDWITNVQMIYKKPKQFYEALEFVLESYNQQKKMYIVGHSLGGAIAEYVGNAINKDNIMVITFNGAGVAHLIKPNFIDNVYHLVTTKDILNRLTKILPFKLFKHIGKVVVIKDDKSWNGLQSHSNWQVFMSFSENERGVINETLTN